MAESGGAKVAVQQAIFAFQYYYNHLTKIAIRELLCTAQCFDTLETVSKTMDEEIRLYCEKRAEYELAAAEAADDERHRRKHYFQASLYLNLLYGGDPRTEAPLGFTY